MPLVSRLFLSAACAAGAAFVSALVLVVVELYLTGHSIGSITGPFLDWPPAGVHLSLADVIFLAAIALGGSIPWLVTRGSR